MAWVKIPKEHHPLFLSALPKTPRPTTINMFGGIAATVNGNMACGLFGGSVMVRLGDADRAEALALDGAALFDPMGKGASHGEDKVQLPAQVMEDPAELRGWLQRALDHTATLPRKAKKSSAPKPAKHRAATKPAAKQPATRKGAPKKSAAKAAAKKSTAKQPGASKVAAKNRR